MKVNPIIYSICFECSVIENGEIYHEYTTQYLREIRIPQSRGCFSSRRPILEYVCGKCGDQSIH